MLSIAAVASAGGAASYYASDNYYTEGQLTEHSQWAGLGAAALGLSGTVEQDRFEAVLAGRLAEGIAIRDGVRGAHRPGLDLTFSAPKSVSLLAYLGGDARLLDAHRAAVIDALGWAERQLAEARVSTGRGQQRQRTGNLVVALFQHDTSRLLDPQAHIHAVVANATRTASGQWRALSERPLWEDVTAIASVYNAAFRQKVEALGYITEYAGKHGQFEIAGIPRAVIAAFSQRRAEITREAASLAHPSPAAMQIVTLRTRGDKPADIDRAALHAQWQARAAGLGFDAPSLVEAARARAAREPTGWQRLVEGVRGVAAQARVLAERLGLSTGERDPLVPERPGRLAPPDHAAALAVAAGVRHLSEREAAFRPLALVKAALDLGAPVSATAVEARIALLTDKGLLRTSADGRMMTTAAAIADERAWAAELARGQGAARSLWQGNAKAEPRDAPSPPSVPAKGMAREAALEGADNGLDQQLTATAKGLGLRLTAGQRRAARAILAGDDRIMAIQGNAGTGKSAMLAPVARMAHDAGHRVIALAVSNQVAGSLGKDLGIEAMTVARFLARHADGRHADQLAGAVLIVDEASLLPTRLALALGRLANEARIARLVLIGDAKQLGAVEAGKPFTQSQHHGTPILAENLRARTPAMQAIHAAAQSHDIARLARLIAPHSIETSDGVAAAAAARWVGLSPEDRAQTGLFTTGRRLRDAVNQAVQQARLEQGELGIAVTISGMLHPLDLTREEQRLARSYAAGQAIELPRGLPGQGLPAGLAQIVAVTPAGKVMLDYPGGDRRQFDPARLPGNAGADLVRLYQPATATFHIGDQLRFATGDPRRGIAPADTATLTAASRDGLTLTTSTGRSISLATTDPLLRRLSLGYALNAHQAQGTTTTHAIIAAHAREGLLLSRSLTHVLFTRARETLTFITDSAETYTHQAERRSGEKTSALTVEERVQPVAAREPSTPTPLEKAEPARDMPVPERQRGLDFGL
jgi:conjugative relaxase-like TrwC/TraI family protein